MKRFLPLLISLLAIGAGCAAPAGDSGLGERAAGDGTAAEAPGEGRAGPPDAAPPEEIEQTPPAGSSEPAPGSPAAQAPQEPQAPSWWSEAPVRQGGEVSVCAQATAPTLREARQQAIRAAYDRLEGELGGPATTAAIGSDYAATREGDQWRFRVRVTGSK